MKPELIEHANRIASNTHRSSNRRWGICDVADGAFDLLSGLIELLFAIF